MNSLNQAQIIGNITREIDVRTTKNNNTVCTIGVATNRRWKDQSGTVHDEAEFHNVVCWGKLAELCRDLLKKGSRVYFCGRLQTRNWEDEAGVKHFRTEIIADDMIVLSPRNRENESESASSNDNISEEKTIPLEGSPDEIPTL